MDSIKTQPRRRILVTGATGKQGGAVVKALLEQPPPCDDFEILAPTRNTSSPAAKSLAENPRIKLIAGDLNHASDIFEQAGGPESVWGVFSVQLPDVKADPWSAENKEYRQGKDLVELSIEYGVKHFVQASVDRCGDRSDDNPTDIAHFITKHRIEQHLKATAKDSNMTYTILRPVAFMDMMTPNFFGRVFAAMVQGLGDTPLQLVATRDIGIFAAQAFSSPGTDEYKNVAISIAGDELNIQGCNEAFWKALHRPIPVTYYFFGALLKKMIPEVGTMFDWFKEVGYGADIQRCRRLNARMLDLPAFLKQESHFTR